MCEQPRGHAGGGQHEDQAEDLPRLAVIAISLWQPTHPRQRRFAAERNLLVTGAPNLEPPLRFRRAPSQGVLPIRDQTTTIRAGYACHRTGVGPVPRATRGVVRGSAALPQEHPARRHRPALEYRVSATRTTVLMMQHCHGFKPGVDLQLGEHVLDVRARGGIADVHGQREGTSAVTEGQQPERLALSRREFADRALPTAGDASGGYTHQTRMRADRSVPHSSAVRG